MSSFAFSDSPDSPPSREFEQLIRDSIAAIKNGNRSLAKKLLDQAALIDRDDARVWIWLSATTDDPQERYSYLERAVALDPSNTTAKRGLQMLADQLHKPSQAPEAVPIVPQQPAIIHETTYKAYLCPNCGATISYGIHDTTLVCQFCGFTRKVDQNVVSKSTEQTSETVAPVSHAHRWADTQSRLTCEQCGAVILLPSGQTVESCPYCASIRFIPSATLMDISDPQVIGLFQVDAENAAKNIKTWLGKGLFAPDNLADKHAGMLLHPAYYPFWIFDGTLEIPWFCDVNAGTSSAPAWEPHSGSRLETFKEVVVPGLKKLYARDLADIVPFNLKELVEFSPEHQANWAIITYDIPLVDASLRARDIVIKKIQRSLPSLVEPKRTKRNFSIGEGKWSGLTYKLALLPIYIGNYPFQGKRYRLFINGQTGKVSGIKPVDNIKIAMLFAGILLVLIIIVLVFSLFR